MHFLLVFNPENKKDGIIRLLKDIVPGNPGKTSKFADCQNLIEDFTNAILWAESLEPAIIQGVDANNFAPNAPITRA